MSHTMGPWRIPRYQTKFGQIDITTKTGHFIARVEAPDNNWSNAELIVQAPALLKGIKLALMEFERISYQKKANPEIIELLEKAVALAEGKVKS